MDLAPFDGLVQELRSRREAVTRHAADLRHVLSCLGWQGPAADRFGERERSLIADLDALAQLCDQAMVTAQQLADEWEQDMAEARKMISSFTGMVARVKDVADDAVDSAKEAVNYDDWPVKPGNAIPQPGDEGWEAFSDFMRSRT